MNIESIYFNNLNIKINYNVVQIPTIEVLFNNDYIIF